MNRPAASIREPSTEAKRLRKSSVSFDMHFNFFGIDPTGKTIRTIVLELKERAHENFIRKCHFQNSYQFGDFRLTRDYRLSRELRNHLLQLSIWLFRESSIPASLKKELTRSVRFRNPYFSFDVAKVENLDLKSLSPVTLSVLHNKNLLQKFPDKELQKRIFQELGNRKIDVSEIGFSEKIEIVKRNRKLLVLNL